LAPPRSWFKGIFTNLLSPHPWLFWLTVGAAILAKAIAQSWPVAVAFLFGFYVLLVGSKMLVSGFSCHCLSAHRISTNSIRLMDLVDGYAGIP
jgi:threonine/homoserine/homoserine lactone efflux protein